MRALFFDAAGTLIEPAEPVAEVYARAAQEAGHPVDADLLKEAFGGAFADSGDPAWHTHPHDDGDAAEQAWWEAVVAATFGRVLGSPLPEGFFTPVFQSLFSHYAAPEAWRVFPEVREVLQASRDAGFKIAVVSNFDRRLHGILRGHGLDFDLVVTSADARSRKPEARIFHHALGHLGLQPGEAYHTGDSRRADQEGARAAGLEAYLLDRPHTDLRDFLRLALEKRQK